MAQIVTANPFRCRPWILHDRLAEHLSEERCKKEIKSFEEHGQLIPALGRVIRGDPDFDFEIICGARRLFVARHLNKQLIIEVRPLSDKDAIVAMDIENRLRQDLSPYERGLSYIQFLRAGHFDSQDALARALKISPSQVSRLIKVARLPAVIISAFTSAAEICEDWGLKLSEMLDDPETKQMTIRTARGISSSLKRPSSSEVYRQLITSSVQGKRPRIMSHDKVIRGKAETPLFRIRHQRESIALLLPAQKVSATALREIENAVINVLENQSATNTSGNHERRQAMSIT